MTKVEDVAEEVGAGADVESQVRFALPALAHLEDTNHLKIVAPSTHAQTVLAQLASWSSYSSVHIAKKAPAQTPLGSQKLATLLPHPSLSRLDCQRKCMTPQIRSF